MSGTGWRPAVPATFTRAKMLGFRFPGQGEPQATLKDEQQMLRWDPGPPGPADPTPTPHGPRARHCQGARETHLGHQPRQHWWKAPRAEGDTNHAWKDAVHDGAHWGTFVGRTFPYACPGPQFLQPGTPILFTCAPFFFSLS